MSSQQNTIKVEVETQYIEQDSSPENKQYLFSYTVTIINLGKQPAKLTNRHWLITDANGNTNEVQGEGVVGETPTIAPDSAYQYSSGTVLETPLGVMQGYYTMIATDGTKFKATIEPFRLATPHILH